MKRLYIALFALVLCAMTANAKVGWPSGYTGVMLQGFYWDSYDDTRWTVLEKQADELASYFDLIWIPQSGYSQSQQNMGYLPLYWFSNYSSSFGSEAQLRSMITTFKNAGLGTIADVVINHRGNVSNWVDFPAETYNGVTYQMVSTDICANDDGGDTKTWADANGYSLSSNNDTGEDWSGARDLDHNSSNVQKCVKAYLDFLLNDLGYAGFRYDMTKGYSASFTGQYNNEANPTYSVGEYWDGNATTVKSWIDGTKVDGVIQSAAFDFPFRYTVRDAINNSNWSNLANSSLMSDAAYRQYAVTFVENHDTEYRSATASQDPIKKDTLAANAWLLATPGTPCVFLKHWQAYKEEIKAMIDARKVAGVTNTSSLTKYASSTNYYAGYTTGTNGQLLAVVGTNAGTYTPTSKWVKILSGYHYAYYLSKSTGTAWVDKPSGTYKSAFDATLTAISSDTSAKLVYTTDGTDPTASSTSVSSGTKINISTACTLKVGLLINGVVSGIVTRVYDFEEASTFEPYEITVYVNVDNVGWSTVNFWTWGGDGTHAPTNTSWPGDKVTTTTTIDGKTWYYKTYTINSEDDYVSFVFSTGTGTPQTVDVNYVNKTSYFVISTEKSGANYLVNDDTDNHDTTGINDITTDTQKHNGNVYSLDGRLVRANANSVEGLAKGIYILNGKKIVVK